MAKHDNQPKSRVKVDVKVLAALVGVGQVIQKLDDGQQAGLGLAPTNRAVVDAAVYEGQRTLGVLPDLAKAGTAL